MKTDIFHRRIAQIFLEKRDSEFTKDIKRITARKILYLNHVPINLHVKFLDEMEHLGLIKLKDQKNIEILVERE